MDVPLEECLKRNAQRPRTLPRYVVERIYKNLQKPTLDEGWDKIITTSN